MHRTENISFEIFLGNQFYDKPGTVTVFIDEQEKFNATLTTPGLVEIKFDHKLVLQRKHKLKIVRTGKTPDQTIVDDNGNLIKDQIIWLEKLIIDKIDVQGLIYKNSYFYPNFKPQEAIQSGTHWGVDGSWELEFTSPFYMYLIRNFQ